MPDEDIQKVIIPQRGSPYPLKSTEIRFDMPNGSLVVTKTDAVGGSALVGATFELTNASGAVVATQTTARTARRALITFRQGIIPCGKSARRRVISFLRRTVRT